MSAPASNADPAAQDDDPAAASVSAELASAEAQTSHREQIETVIAALEQDDSAMVNHGSEAYLWKFRYGSVEVLVRLTGEGDGDTLTVWSPVLSLPARDEARLMRQLLELNWSDTFEACFSIFNQQAVVAINRTNAGLTPGEISRAITLVATVADDNDERLQAEFGTA